MISIDADSPEQEGRHAVARIAAVALKHLSAVPGIAITMA
jgi:hypothetical protein